jgi:transcription elongation factor Elf1
LPDSWALLLKKKVHEENPFFCPKCGRAKIVAGLIDELVKLKKIV